MADLSLREGSDHHPHQRAVVCMERFTSKIIFQQSARSYNHNQIQVFRVRRRSFQPFWS